MALWQFNVALLPQSWLDGGGDVIDLFGEEGFESVAAWRGYDEIRLQNSLDEILSRGKSWHPELTLWGSNDSDDIQLWRDAGEVVSVQVRFDLRKPNMALFGEVVDITRALRLAILVLATRRILPADIGDLIRAAAESDAAHFVVDPASFLSDLQAANEKAI
jgi:hypothetical protein